MSNVGAWLAFNSGNYLSRRWAERGRATMATGGPRECVGKERKVLTNVHNMSTASRLSTRVNEWKMHCVPL